MSSNAIFAIKRKSPTGVKRDEVQQCVYHRDWRCVCKPRPACAFWEKGQCAPGGLQTSSGMDEE